MNCIRTEIVGFDNSSRGPEDTFTEHLRTSWRINMSSRYYGKISV